MTPIRDRPIFFAQLVFTLLVAAFLIVPAVLSMMAGVTVNYFQGIRSGLTLQWVAQVWELYPDTIFRSFLIAFATLGVTLVVGIPAAYALHLRNDRLSRAMEEIITLPLAIPGLAIALALLLTYDGFSDFRRSWLFILVGHVIFTLPFMVRSVMAVFAAIDVKTLDEGAASLGASPWRRFRDVIVPNARPGILAGALMVVTLSLGEFNLTWMLHTPLTKTLPVGLGRQLCLDAARSGVGLYAGLLRHDHSAADRHADVRRLSRQRHGLAAMSAPRCRAAYRSLRQDVRRRHPRARARQPRHRARRDHGAARPVRLRQDHIAAHDRRPGNAGRRRQNIIQRCRRDRRADRAAQYRHGVPILRAVSQHERRRQYRLRPENPRRP